MRPVTRVSLNGRALQLEDDAHALLAQYLESAARALDANPDRAEILADLEVAVVEKSARFLGPARDVLNREQIASVLDEIGPVEPVGNATASDGTAGVAASGDTGSGATLGASAGASAGSAEQARSDANAGAAPRRLHQITDGAMIAGVCNGLAAWLGVDATVVRIVAVILAFATGGAAILAYLLLMLILPYTPQSGTTRGLPRATRNLIERIRGESAAFTSSEDWQRFRADARETWGRTRASAQRQWEAWRHSRAPAAAGGHRDVAAAGASGSPGQLGLADVQRTSDTAPSPLVVLALIVLLIAAVALS